MSNQFLGEYKNVICFSCKNFKFAGGCDAFPDGTPDIILSGKISIRDRCPIREIR
jgi:hypothetical protein